MTEESLRRLEKQLKKKKIEGFLIIKQNERIFEYVKNKKVKEKPTKVYSITKSVISILIGILIDKGLIQDVNFPIYHFSPELQNHQQKKEITIYHLLTMSSGLSEKGGQIGSAKHWVKFMLDKPLEHTPGEIFQYSSGSSHLLSAIIHKVTGRPTAAFADECLFGPLGIKNYSWTTDPQGIHGGGFSLFLNIEDMMKIGTLYVQNGTFKFKQIVSKEWIENTQIPRHILEKDHLGTFGYGYQCWTFHNEKSENSIECFYANGIYGQFIIVVPKLNMVGVAKSLLKNEDATLPFTFFYEYLQGIG
jgi:CubicO group peptidase (beta-lactamase class C family)